MKPTRKNILVLVAIAYVPALLCMMNIGVVVPFIDTLSRDLSSSPAQLGLAIALFSVPTAVLATMSGGLIDRYGIRRSMLVAAGIATLGSLLASQSQSLPMLYCAMLLSGLGYGGIAVAAPCLLIASLSDGTRIRAMSFWSTYAPTGYAGGLLLAVPFTGSGSWRIAMLSHAALMALAFLAMLRFLPHAAPASSQQRGSLRQSIAQMLAIVREPRVVRLAIAVALPNAVSYGTSLAAPAYLAHMHNLSIAASSATVAFAKIVAMIIGGLSMGYLLSRAVRASLLFTIMAAVGALAQVVLFMPASGITLATAALILWLFAFGGMAGGAMTLLPAVVNEPARTGGASGLVNQAISLASFAAPSTWLALHDGLHFVLLAAACLLVSLIALPGSAMRRPAHA